MLPSSRAISPGRAPASLSWAKRSATSRAQRLDASSDDTVAWLASFWKTLTAMRAGPSGPNIGSTVAFTAPAASKCRNSSPNTWGWPKMASTSARTSP